MLHFGLTVDERVWRKLALSWGVTPVMSPEYDSVDVLFHYAKQAARDNVGLQSGDHLVITGGRPNGHPGNTNQIRIETI